MGLLPDVEGGEIKEQPEGKVYAPPKWYWKKGQEDKIREWNNLGHKPVSEDFSDSPVLNN